MNDNYINHIALVIDASSSMSSLAPKVIEVVDQQVDHLATRSRELDQETRATVYVFNTEVECLFYDKDVLRLPSLKGRYRTSGMTALIDATIKSQQDLAKTAQLYGDHAFLSYVITDGMENASKKKPAQLKEILAFHPENWTVAALAPDQKGFKWCEQVGFQRGNIALWDASSAKGLDDSFTFIRQATDSFMEARATGTFKGTRGLFDMSSANLNKQAVKSALQEVPKTQYKLIDVVYGPHDQIRTFVENQLGIPYRQGIAFYQLTKSEDIQPQKKIMVYDRKAKKVYGGQSARDLLGLPNVNVRVRPQDNPDFDVFVQSTSVNRKLVPGTKVLVTT